MANVQGTFYRGETQRSGVTPTSPPNAVDDPVGPLNPPGSNPILNAGIGIKLNGQVIGGVKRVIESNNTLDIPEFWQYNIRGLTLDVDGVIENNGEINIG